LFYTFLDDKNVIGECLEYEHDRTHTADDCVILG